MSLSKLNHLDPAVVRRVYAEVVPARMWEYLAEFDPLHLSGGPENPRTFTVVATPGRADAHLRAPADRVGGEYALSLDLDDLGANQLELSFVVINDLRSRRYNIDVDEQGRMNLLDTASRNIPQEIEAMRAGLGPCQVRPGLRMLHELLARLEDLGKKLGYVAISLEPLTYHSTLMYENYGFGYLTGYSRMVQINQAFGAGGVLARAMDGSTPFRGTEAGGAESPYGRSWAIHDGILEKLDGDAHLEVHLVKPIGVDCKQRTFDLNVRAGTTKD
ncbi:MAG: hypothetical protein IT441_05370 [Phycisphaeraceae bacterium]|nr:hypothetical protein [Phycisphaeraceae bacterium]